MSNSKIQDNSGSAAAPAKSSFWYDRGAVLFIGIAVGSVLSISFQAEGKPFNFLFEDTEVSASVNATTAPVKANETLGRSCIDNFPMAPRVLAALRSDAPIKVGVFGDSFGDGIWAGTLQELRDKETFKVFRFAKESTGFTRYNTVNLLDDTKTKIAADPMDVAIVSFGANDTQGVWVGGRAAPYMSNEWKAEIGNRASQLVKALQAQGVAVGWVGLPRMRKASYDQQVQQMNSFYSDLMCDLGVPFVNPVALTEDKNHMFIRELTDATTGKKYVARADDGIHMTTRGYRFVASPLLKRIKALAPTAPNTVDEGQ